MHGGFDNVEVKDYRGVLRSDKDNSTIFSTFDA